MKKPKFQIGDYVAQDSLNQGCVVAVKESYPGGPMMYRISNKECDFWRTEALLRKINKPSKQTKLMEGVNKCL